MKIYKRKTSSYYWVTFMEGSTQIRQSLKTSSKKIASELVSEMEKQRFLLANGIAVAKVTNSTLGQLVDDYVSNVVDQSANAQSTKQRDRAVIKCFTDFIKPSTFLVDIKETNINRYVSMRLASGKAQVTVAKDRSILTKLFEYGKKDPYSLTVNPFSWSQKAKDLSTITEIKPPVPWDKIHFAIENADRVEDKMFWSILAYTGMQPNDAMKVTQDDFERGYYFRNKSKVKFYLFYHPEIKKYGEDAFGFYTTKSHSDKSGKRFKKLTGFTQGAMRRQFATTISDKVGGEKAIEYTGHTNTKTLKKHYWTQSDKVIREVLINVAPDLAKSRAKA